ncbi:MAG: hypothetical protein JWQ04_352, partial [Pedosphaera sp.]|nr:hypothetical protein [Pedosphaera sp.]
MVLSMIVMIVMMFEQKPRGGTFLFHICFHPWLAAASFQLILSALLKLALWPDAFSHQKFRRAGDDIILQLANAF